MKIKVCGMKYGDNILELAALHPDFMGFIFYPSSKRYVGEDFVLPALPSKIKKVGVFVNDTIERVKEKVKRYSLDYVQLHGDESADYCKQLVGVVKIIKAFGINEAFDFSLLAAYENVCDYFLFDTKTPAYGGSGNSFDKELLKKYKSSKPFFLSGGLDSDAACINHQLHPTLYAIDVNSKFEDAAAIKNINKLKQLFNEVSGK